MEHIFPGRYIRVYKPVTHDGQNIKLDGQFRGQFKVVDLPFTAKADIEARNAKLPDALKMRIEVVDPYEPIAIPKPKAEPQPEADNQPAKRGPKPKQNDLD